MRSVHTSNLGNVKHAIIIIVPLTGEGLGIDLP